MKTKFDPTDDQPTKKTEEPTKPEEVKEPVAEEKKEDIVGDEDKKG